MSRGNAWGEYIRRMLTARGMSIAELARRSGINRSTLSGYVNHGPGNINLETIQMIADALDGDPVEAVLSAVSPAGRVALVTDGDPEFDLIRLSDMSDEQKDRMIVRVKRRRIEDALRRLDELRVEIEAREDRSDVG